MNVLVDREVRGIVLTDPDLDEEPYTPIDLQRVYTDRKEDGPFQSPRCGVYPSEANGG